MTRSFGKRPAEFRLQDVTAPEDELSCCEYRNRKGEVAHVLLNSCCDCEAVDELGDSCIRCLPFRSSSLTELRSTLADRVRVPRPGGAVSPWLALSHSLTALRRFLLTLCSRSHSSWSVANAAVTVVQVQCDAVAPIFIIPTLLVLATQNEWATLAVCALTPVALLLLSWRWRGSPSRPRTRFFFSWALVSVFCMLYVFLIGVLFTRLINLWEGMIVLFGIIFTFYFLFLAKQDPGTLRSQRSAVGQTVPAPSSARGPWRHCPNGGADGRGRHTSGSGSHGVSWHNEAHSHGSGGRKGCISGTSPSQEKTLVQHATSRPLPPERLAEVSAHMIGRLPSVSDRTSVTSPRAGIPPLKLWNHVNGAAGGNAMLSASQNTATSMATSSAAVLDLEAVPSIGSPGSSLGSGAAWGGFMEESLAGDHADRGEGHGSRPPVSGGKRKRTVSESLPEKDILWVDSRKIRDGRLQTYCEICSVTQPRRASHCNVCNQCIEERDHHCIWIDQCIGKRNHKAFLAALATVILTTMYALHLSLTTICTPDMIYDFILYPRDCRFVYSDFLHAVTFVSCCYTMTCIMLLMAVLLQQLTLISQNITLTEHNMAARRRWVRHAGLIATNNEYNHGSVWVNWMAFILSRRQLTRGEWVASGQRRRGGGIQ